MAVVAQGAGQLYAAIQQVYELCDEPQLRAKYKPERIINLMMEVWPQMLSEIYGSIDNPPVARFNFTIVPGQEYYQLPACVGEVRRIVTFRDEIDGGVFAEALPRGDLNPFGPGWQLQGRNRLRIMPIIQSDQAQDWQIEYIPSGDVLLGYGHIRGSSCSTTTIQLPTVVGGTGPQFLGGALDRRDNAYVGSFISLLSHTGDVAPTGYANYPVQERIITAHDVATGVLTVDTLDFNPGQAGFANAEAESQWHTFEIYPFEAPSIWTVIVPAVARRMWMFHGNVGRANLCLSLEREAKAALFRRLTAMQTRKLRSFNGDDPENIFYANYW